MPRLQSLDTALSLAIWQNHTAVCLLLISAGAFVDNVDKFGDTMLLDAAKHGNVAVMHRLLSQQRISIDHANKKGDTALIRAAWKGELEALRLLIDRGADVSIRNGSGCTALLMAAMHNNRACFLALLDCASPAVLNACDESGNNALFYLASFSPLHSSPAKEREEPFWDGMNRLIPRGIALHTPPDMGNLLLCRAANSARIDTVQALLNRRAEGDAHIDVNYVDPNNKGQTAAAARTTRTHTAPLLTPSAPLPDAVACSQCCGAPLSLHSARSRRLCVVSCWHPLQRGAAEL